jgi:hypothetical protein
LGLNIHNSIAPGRFQIEVYPEVPDPVKQVADPPKNASQYLYWPFNDFQSPFFRSLDFTPAGSEDYYYLWHYLHAKDAFGNSILADDSIRARCDAQQWWNPGVRGSRFKGMGSDPSWRQGKKFIFDPLTLMEDDVEKIAGVENGMAMDSSFGITQERKEDNLYNGRAATVEIGVVNEWKSEEGSNSGKRYYERVDQDNLVVTGADWQPWIDNEQSDYQLDMELDTSTLNFKMSATLLQNSKYTLK